MVEHEICLLTWALCHIEQVPLDNAFVLGNLCEYHCNISLITRFFELHFCCREYRSIFNHYDVIGRIY